MEESLNKMERVTEIVRKNLKFVFFDQGNDRELHFEYKEGSLYADLLQLGTVTKIGPIGTPDSSSVDLAGLIWQIVEDQNFFKNLYERLIQWTGRQSGYPNLKKIFDAALENHDVLLLGELSRLIFAVGAGVYEEGEQEEEEFEEEDEVIRSPKVTWTDLPPVVLKLTDHFGRIYFNLIEEAFIFKCWERSGSDVEEIWFRYKDTYLKYEVYSRIWWDWDEFYKTSELRRKPLKIGRIFAPKVSVGEIVQEMEQVLVEMGYYESVTRRIAEFAEVYPQLTSIFQSPMAKAIHRAGLPLQKELSLLLNDLVTRSWS